jgi:hypothetical protein
MSILKSTNSGIHGIKVDKEILLTELKELGYDITGSYYVSTNEKYRFLPNINLEDVYVRDEQQWHFYINIITTNGDQHYSFYHRYIINTYSDFLTFKKDINIYIDKYVNS